MLCQCHVLATQCQSFEVEGSNYQPKGLLVDCHFPSGDARVCHQFKGKDFASAIFQTHHLDRVGLFIMGNWYGESQGHPPVHACPVMISADPMQILDNHVAC